MKFNELTDSFYKIPDVDLSNTFDVVEVTNKNKTVDTVYNWNISCGITGLDDIPEGMISYYTVKTNDHLKLISYSLYGTIDFWWLIAKINGIDDALQTLEPGSKLITFSNQTMGAIYSEILSLSKSNSVE